MRIHLIAIGGSAMHNLAIALHYNHHTVTGSDDEIYNPAFNRLKKIGLLPDQIGWDSERVTKDIDLIILGMHARQDNPELIKAKELKIPVISYPEYIYKHAIGKKRIVVAGSHGKTTTTAMILHVMKASGLDFDYLVGAQLDDFENMVRLSDAPVIVIEGDEYLSSPIDLKPKILHYKPHIAVITGIAWDHINVFPSFENYVEQFHKFVACMDTEGQLFYYENDENILKIIKDFPELKKTGYHAFDSKTIDGKCILIYKGNEVPLEIFGKHNLENLKAAFLVCKSIGISDEQFFEKIKNFRGAAKRMQILNKNSSSLILQDFAHAPSKVKATIQATKSQFPDRQLTACLELHTFSSLNRHFLKEYFGSMNAADQAFVYFSEHTLAMKKLPPISKDDIQTAFGHKNLKVFTNNTILAESLLAMNWKNHNLLLMSSGTFNGLDLKHLSAKMVEH